MYEYPWDSFEFEEDNCLPPEENIFQEYFDLDNDGYYETLVTNVDSDNDGIYETTILETDSNKDGTFESFQIQEDLNGDGYQETVTAYFDSNNNGSIEQVVTVVDTNGDGVPDYVNKSYDHDEDGIFDRSKTYVDEDYNGVFDTIFNVHDDLVEVITRDPNGNPQTASYHIDPETGDIIFTGEIYADTSYTGIDLPNYDPSLSDPSKVVGNPEESMAHWECQGTTNRCALFSQLFVIEELTGEELDIEEFARFATQNGWFTEDGGTSFNDMDKMLIAYDIPHEMSYYNDIDDIEQCLENGGKVIVAVDANEIWYGESNNDLFSPSSGANHAVEVIGIDRTDPDNPMVILNDSGPSSGCGEMVPLDRFIDAWQDSDCQMIECYKN